MAVVSDSHYNSTTHPEQPDRGTQERLHQYLYHPSKRVHRSSPRRPHNGLDTLVNCPKGKQ